MTLAAPRTAGMPRRTPSTAAAAGYSADQAPSPVFRGILVAGLLSLPFWGGLALVVTLVVR